MAAMLAAGASARHEMFRTSDSPFFLAVARHPFGSGQLPGNPLVYGVAYRYGRVMFPLAGWVFALGRPSWVAGSLVAVYFASFAAWVAFAAEHLRRSGRRPVHALWILALPSVLVSYVKPIIVSEPMAGALLLLVYLFARDGRRLAMAVAAAALVLTREPMVLALVPLAWSGWQQRRFAALRDWTPVIAPYVLWITWVRLRVGQFPFLDPSTSRRNALALPFVGWVRTWEHGVSAGQQVALVVAGLTVVAAVLLAWRGNRRSPLVAGAVALTLLVPLLGISVFAWWDEALRVMAPIQAFLLIAWLDRGASALSS